MAESKREQKKYPPELKERAVKMVLELRREDPSDHGVVSRVSRQLGVGQESLRKWVIQAEREKGRRGGLSTDEQTELKELRKENRELKRSNAILRSASAFFAAELDRPPTR
jgi:transposase